MLVNGKTYNFFVCCKMNDPKEDSNSIQSHPFVCIHDVNGKTYSVEDDQREERGQAKPSNRSGQLTATAIRPP